MQLFYCPEIHNGTAALPEEEARHCVQVLRHRAGDRIELVDGRGYRYQAEITETGKKRCRLRILSQRPVPSHPFHLHIAIAPTKNMDRFEWFLEKATEIGIDEITPLLCHHSERRKLRLDRCERVLLAAMKQSLKAKLPLLHPLTPISDFVAQPQWNSHPGRFIATCVDGPKIPLKEKTAGLPEVLILIGPEGDFDENELEQAAEAGFQKVSLGPSRLRTETAGVVACHTVHIVS